jgi:hypothetical protein
LGQNDRAERRQDGGDHHGGDQLRVEVVRLGLLAESLKRLYDALLTGGILPISHVANRRIQREPYGVNVASSVVILRRQKTNGEGLPALEEFMELRLHGFGLLEVLRDQFHDLSFKVRYLGVIGKECVSIRVARRLRLVEHEVTCDYPLSDQRMFREEFPELVNRALTKRRNQAVNQVIWIDALRGQESGPY